MVIGTRPAPILGYPLGNATYTNITPFTHRDGLTYLNVLEQLRYYINARLIQHIDAQFAAILIAWETEIAKLVEEVNAVLISQRVTIDVDESEIFATITIGI